MAHILFFLAALLSACIRKHECRCTTYFVNKDSTGVTVTPIRNTFGQAKLTCSQIEESLKFTYEATKKLARVECVLE